MARLLINIDVPDLASGIDFYSNGLGFDLQRTLFEQSVAELTLDQALVYLISQEAGSLPFASAPLGRSFSRHWTPVHLDVVVEDLDSAVHKALRAGAAMPDPPKTDSWGRLACLADPFGHGFCLLEFTARGYDLVAD